MVGRVVQAAHVDAVGRADTGAELAADALLHSVLVAVQDVAAVLARLLGLLLLRVLGGDPGPAQVLEGQLESAQERQLVLHLVAPAHYASPPLVGSVGRGGVNRKGRVTRPPTVGMTR